MMKKTLLNILIILSTLVLAAIIRYRSKYIPPPKIKNVMMINIDSLRADHMGVYGYKKNTTPFLDSLFEKGVVFEKAIAPAYLTYQTDAAIFSGLYPSQNNVTMWSTPINPKIITLPQILKIYGYARTAYVSPSLWTNFGFSNDFDDYIMTTYLKNITETKNLASRKLIYSKKPLFLFWHIYDVHWPYIAPSLEFYKNDYSGIFARLNSWKEETQSKTSWYYQSTSPKLVEYKLTKEDEAYLKASYDSGLRMTDEQLKIFFTSIQDDPAYKNTLFIITAEHGEDLKEHGYFFHGDIYDVNIHVPLVFIHPSLKPRRVKENVSLLDIMPTVLHLLGIPNNESGQGTNLTPLLIGKTIDTQRSIFTERAPFGEYALHKGDWKYILRNPILKKNKNVSLGTDEGSFFADILKNDNLDKDELYNLKTDPNEQNNLIGTGLTVEKIMRDEILLFRDKIEQAKKANINVKEIDPKNLQPYP